MKRVEGAIALDELCKLKNFVIVRDKRSEIYLEVPAAKVVEPKELNGVVVLCLEPCKSVSIDGSEVKVSVSKDQEVGEALIGVEGDALGCSAKGWASGYGVRVCL